MKNRILVLGYFGYKNDQLDGQTVKTRSIYDLFKLKVNDNSVVDYFDTQKFQSSIFSIFSMVVKIFRCNKLIYLPAQNNLNYIFPFIYIICKLKKTPILYFVVGGWLNDYLTSKKLHIYFLSKIKAILTESKYLSKTLIEKYHFKNVITFLNFRIHGFIPKFENDSNKFRIVFMARINRMKGLDYVFDMANFFNSNPFPKRSIIIDIYGPLESKNEEYFFSNLKKYRNIYYKGILNPNNIYETLNNYDIMIFPTRFYTEGFPGTVLDAYISGLPVVATNWKYASDFIIPWETGLIVPFEKSEKEFIDAVVKICNDDGLLLKMKKLAYDKSKSYSSEIAWDILIQNNLLN